MGVRLLSGLVKEAAYLEQPWKQPQLSTLFHKLFSFDKPLSRHHVNQKATQAA
jgi:hypothetical protein